MKSLSVLSSAQTSQVMSSVCDVNMLIVKKSKEVERLAVVPSTFAERARRGSMMVSPRLEGEEWSRILGEYCWKTRRPLEKKRSLGMSQWR